MGVLVFSCSWISWIHSSIFGAEEAVAPRMISAMGSPWYLGTLCSTLMRSDLERTLIWVWSLKLDQILRWARRLQAIFRGHGRFSAANLTGQVSSQYWFPIGRIARLSWEDLPQPAIKNHYRLPSECLGVCVTSSLNVETVLNMKRYPKNFSFEQWIVSAWHP